MDTGEDGTKGDAAAGRTLFNKQRPERGDGFGSEPDNRATGADSSDGVASRRAKLVLVGVIVVFVVLGTFIAIKTPAYESADEPGHVQNIETLVRGHWYGMRCQVIGTRSIQCSGDEAHQAPLYYLAFAGWQRLVGLPSRAPYNGPTNYVDQNGDFMHHSSADHRFLLWLRLPNVFLGVLTVLFTFFAVRLVSSDPWTPVVGASIVAFLPRFVFLSAFVTNDNLVNLLGTILTVVAIRFAQRHSRWRMVPVGAVVGLLLITKLSALPIALVLVVLSCMVQGWKRRAEFLGIGVMSTLVVSGWYFVQNTVRYGDPLARTVSAGYLSLVGGLGGLGFGVPYRAGNPLSLIFDRVLARIGNSFWYQSGWGQFHWSWPVNLIFWLALVGALAGLVQRHIAGNTLVTLLTIAAAAFLSVWVVAFQTATYQARYALVGIAAIAALGSLGLERWKLPVRFLLPAMGLCGTLIAIQQNVLATHWSS